MDNLVYLFKGGSKMKKSVTIFDVADYFLSKLIVNDGSSITPLKLQKLVYYAQAWSLVWDKKQLFNERMEAWAHGPANPDLYSKFKDYGRKGLEPVEDVDLDIFEDYQLETMDAIWDAYGDYDGKYLEQLTHQEDPWLEARGNCKPGEYCDNVISIKSIQIYYTNIYEGDI